ncbi:MAG: hypothetical protein A2252_10445 [Elusimicrobia bacterium RIFOXYA2_FULL_39_19]|nr:MAG: hypothetical protein A2252_10445 [Elusimicrobia bacterium RIFOXYA2_FULL_39_19]
MSEKYGLDIKSLVRLQELDAELDRLNEECELVPAEIEEFKDKITELKKNFDDRKLHIKEIQSKHKGFELDIAAKDDIIKKHKNELNMVKTNEQYKALLNQIANVEAEKGKIEESILKVMEEVESFNRGIKDEENVLKDQEEKINQEIKVYEQKVTDFKGQLVALEEERKQLESSVTPNALKKYEYIRKKCKDGIAITIIENNNCGNCHMQLPAQVINEVSKNDVLVFCENCSKILYIP